MASVLSSFFSRDPKASFAYELPQISFHTAKGISMGKSFKKSEPSEKVTCFWETLDQSGSPESLLKQQAHKLKTMRHPNVLTYLDSIEVDNTFYLITESCVPLSTYISESEWTAAQKEFVVSWGLFQVLSCLKFLHREAKLSHDNLQCSVYVTDAGDWKLSGLQYANSFNNARNDLNALSILLWEIFNGFNEEITKPGSPSKIPQRFRDFYKKIAMPSAARLDAEELLAENRRTGGLLKNKFVDTLLFLDEFQLKDAHDKQTFFTKLNDQLHIFPNDVAKYKILPQLIRSYEYGDAGPHILLPLFKLGHLLDADEYQRTVVPCLCKLVSSPDRVTRVKLLEKIDQFAAHLSPQIVNEKVYGNLSSGFLDTNPAVRESTVKAMVSLADKLNYHNLNTDLMKYLARLQGSDDQPGIRTNATICLGKIACYIDASQRQRILINAFTRSLKDPFPPSRMASILALSATQQYYSLIEVATRVVPALAPLTCDPEKQVRDQSFKALHGFMDKLEKASENPELIPEMEAQVQAGGKSGLLSSDKVPQWASWALKSLSGKFYKGTPTVPTAQSKSTGSDCSDQTTVQDGKQQATSTSHVTQNSNLQSSIQKMETGKQKSDVDGWGDLEDDDVDGEHVNDDDLIGEIDNDNNEHGDKGGWDIDDSNDNETDDWGNGWDSQSNTKGETQKSTFGSSTTTTTAAKSKPKSSHDGGALKLKPSVKKEQLADDDLDYLLGVTTQPKVNKPLVATDKNDSLRTSKNQNVVSNVNSDGWDDDATGGWDDFGSDAKTNNKLSSGWDDSNWGERTNDDSVMDTKEARRAEREARNEARRKELAARRLAKSGGTVGAMRLTKNK